MSRLKVHTLDEHWDIFRAELEAGETKLELIGEISVGEIQDIGLNYVAGPEIGKKFPKPTVLTVEEDPQDWNKAHAEIPQGISAGLSNQLKRSLVLHVA